MKTKKYNSSLALYIKCFIAICVLLPLSEATAQKSIGIDTLDKPYYVKLHYYKDPLKTGNESNILKSRPTSGAAYWSAFRISPGKDMVLKYLNFDLPVVNSAVVYVPTFNGRYIPAFRGRYELYISGMSHPGEKVASMKQTSTVFADATDVDFNRPFFLKNISISIFGVSSFDKKISITGYDRKPKILYKDYKKFQLAQANKDFEAYLLFGMLMISFVFVFTFYIIHRKIYYLSYALYLFSLVVTYSSWPYYFYFYNIYSNYSDHFYFYLSLNGEISAIFWYMLFLKQFIGIKQNYPELYRLYQVLIYMAIPFAVIYNITVLKDPYNPGFDIFSNTAVLTVSAINLMAISYMFIKRRSIHTTIVFTGSILLLTGLFFATVLPDESIIIYVVTVETLLFMSVISYLDKKNFRKAVERDKLKEINDFKNKLFTDIAHEFRTPLALISAPIARKLEEGLLVEKERPEFEMIQRNTARLSDLVGELLALSKIDAGKLKLQLGRGHVLSLIRALAEPFRYMAGQHKLEYREDIDEDTDEVWFDRDFVEKIIINLLSNAIKYTPEGGKLICNASVTSNILSIIVKNTGKGLSKAESERVFDRYYQADENQQGLGIGLALVKELVTLHKGTINVESEPDGWTIFGLSISVDKKMFNESEVRTNPGTEKSNLILPTVIRTASETPENPDNELPTILIVEDNHDMSILLKSIFENDYNIIMAGNGKEGVELALEHNPDIIISDIMMPVKDGISLTRDLKNDERTGHIPIILLTAKAGEEDELKGIEMGADDYITKPPNSKILMAKVGKRITIRRKLRDKYSREMVFKIKGKERSTTSAHEEFLIKVRHILEQKLTNSSFNVEEFARAMGMSRAHLNRKLNAITGLSPSEFLRSQRLELAKELLEDPNISVKEVGYDVGFNTISYFIKCFKEMYGCTPLEYAKKQSSSGL